MMTKKNRAPLTDEELEKITAHTLVKLKLTDDEVARLRAINERKGRERVERAARFRIEEEPLLAELREVGWNVESVWDLVNSPARYPEAVPVLLRHLSLPYSDQIREGIARALAIPEARHAWPILVEAYKKAPTGPRPDGVGIMRVKDGLAVALSTTATDETLHELIALAKDRSHNPHRVLLLSALKKRRNKSLIVKQAIEELTTDPDLEKEIASWKKR